MHGPRHDDGSNLVLHNEGPCFSSRDHVSNRDAPWEVNPWIKTIRRDPYACGQRQAEGTTVRAREVRPAPKRKRNAPTIHFSGMGAAFESECLVTLIRPPKGTGAAEEPFAGQSACGHDDREHEGAAGRCCRHCTSTQYIPFHGSYFSYSRVSEVAGFYGDTSSSGNVLRQGQLAGWPWRCPRPWAVLVFCWMKRARRTAAGWGASR